MRQLVLIGAICSLATTASAQGKPDDIPGLMKGGFAEVSGWITKAAELVPAERYTYKPVATVRSFGELVAHVADGYNWYCANAAGRKAEWSDAVEKGKTDKATVLAGLKKASDGCVAATAKGQTMQLMQNIGHANLHYGNMITYLRMMGLTPPSS
ncbi:MAG: hypothetical protein H7066_17030 [Cytophagaceae bacterium]|nr:hypothetical protein [Gemmatimonadaceae bacterium]